MGFTETNRINEKQVHCSIAVRKLKNGKWIADVVVGLKFDGSPDRRSATRATEAKAKKEERVFLVEKEMRQGQAPRITFSDFVDQIYWPCKTNLRANTVRCYKRDIKLRLMPTFGNTYIDKISSAAIQNMIDRSCPTRKIATNARETLSSILGVAVRYELIPKNPARNSFSYPKQPEAPIDEYGVWLSSFQEHRKLLDHLKMHHDGERIERMILLGLCFGLRKGEILGLDWGKVDFTKHEISVTQTNIHADGGAFMAPLKTKKSKRRIPIPQYSHNRMRVWAASDESAVDTTPVVPGSRELRMNPHTASDTIRRFVQGSYDDGAKLPRVTLMSLRHSFATACIRAGVEVSSVSAWLGHEETSTTYNRYVKPTIDDLHKDVSLIDFALNNAI